MRSPTGTAATGSWECACRTSILRCGATPCSTPARVRCCGATKRDTWSLSTSPIVRTALDWLLEQDVATLGLETMPRTVENIGFYARLGFFPGHLTVTLTNDIVTRGHQSPVLLSQRKSAAS